MRRSLAALQSHLRQVYQGRAQFDRVRCRSCRTAATSLRYDANPNATESERHNMGRRDHYHVYVIELSKDVLYEARFMKCNPGYLAGKPCVYVGMTGLDPDVRFDKHKAGIQSNRYVQRFGLRLLPDLYEAYNPMSYESARETEVEVGIGLREAGFGVWQA